MRRENAEIARAGFAAFNSRDLNSFLALLDDDVEYDTTDVLLAGPHRGKNAVGEFLGGLWELLDEMWMKPERIEEVDDNTLLVVVHQGARGHGSGVDVEARRGHLVRLREGKIWRVKVFADPAQAFKAVGLPE